MTFSVYTSALKVYSYSSNSSTAIPLYMHAIDVQPDTSTTIDCVRRGYHASIGSCSGLRSNTLYQIQIQIQIYQISVFKYKYVFDPIPDHVIFKL